MPLIRGLLPQLNVLPLDSMVPAVTAGASVPWIIHQTAQRPVLKPAVQKSVDTIRMLNPEYEYRFYDDDAVVGWIAANYGQQVLAFYHRINPKYGAARADLFRYLLIYKCGGVYLDIKSSFDRPLRDVILPSDRFVLSQWPNEPGNEFEGWGQWDDLRLIPGGEFQQCHIIAAAGHPFLKVVIENVLRNISEYNPVLHGVGSLGVFRVTGPIAYTLAINPLLDEYEYRLVDSHSALGFVYSVFPMTGREHRDLFRFHHSRLTEPVVTPTRAVRLVFNTVSGLRRVKSKVLALRRSWLALRRSEGR